MTSERALRNFESWKRLVGLDDDFPVLRSLERRRAFQQLFLAGPHQLKALEALQFRLLSERLAVIVQRGQGCSTYFQFALNEALESSLRHRIVPIPVSFGKRFWEVKGRTKPDWEYEVKLGLMNYILEPKLKDALGRSEYLSLINGYSKEDEIPAYLAGLKGYIRSAEIGNKKIDWSELSKDYQAPDYSASLRSVIDDFRKMGFRILLLIDTSWDRRSEYESLRKKKIRLLSTGLKNFFDSEIFADGRLHHIIFADREALDEITSTAQLDFDYDEIEFPPYSSNELFGILNRHYSWVIDEQSSSLPKFGDLRVDQLPLTAVLDDTFLSHVADKSKGINELIADMKDLILQSLDKPWENVSYRLQFDGNEE